MSDKKENPKQLVFTSEKDQDESIILTGSKSTKVTFKAGPNHLPDSLESTLISIDPVASWTFQNLGLPIKVPVKLNYRERPMSFTIQALETMSLAFAREVTLTFRLRGVDKNDHSIQHRTFKVTAYCPEVQLAI